MPLQFSEQEYKFVGLFVTRLLCDKALEFAENDSIKITDPDLLLELRDILETQYQDGITAISEARLNSDDSFSGIFEDKVSSKLIKRFKFGIAPDDEISYSLVNPDDVENFTEDELDFAAKKASNCTKGIACGAGCISAKKTCRKTADPPTKKKIAEVKKKVKGGGDTKPPEKPKITSSEYKVNRSNHKELINLGQQFSEKYLKEIPASPKLLKLQERIHKAEMDIEERKKQGKQPTHTQSYKFRDIKRGIEDEERSTIPQKIAQFEALKKAIIDKHGISEAIAEKWVSNLNYFGSSLSKDPRAIAEVKETLKEVYRVSGGKGGSSVRYVSSDSERAFANRGGTLETGKAREKITIYHEYAHHIEYRTSGTAESARDWIESRSPSKTPEKLKDLTGINYGNDEVALKDKFIDPYVGKIYGSKGSSTEVISMGVEKFHDPNSMRNFHRQDPEHFHYVLGVLLSED
jgi:hypothetical protein